MVWEGVSVQDLVKGLYQLGKSIEVRLRQAGIEVKLDSVHAEDLYRYVAYSFVVTRIRELVKCVTKILSTIAYEAKTALVCGVKPRLDFLVLCLDLKGWVISDVAIHFRFDEEPVRSNEILVVLEALLGANLERILSPLKPVYFKMRCDANSIDIEIRCKSKDIETAWKIANDMLIVLTAGKRCKHEEVEVMYVRDELHVNVIVWREQ